MPLSPYQAHVEKWKACKLCSLCQKRSKVVLFKGKIPCDVLFVGEAPGVSENVIGIPFVGPAGQLLDKMIAEALRGVGEEFRMGFTNVVACIPLDDEQHKNSEPPADAVKKCAPRLAEIVKICNPRLLISVGKVAAKGLPTDFRGMRAEILHPAAILKAHQADQGLLVQRTTLAIRDALTIPF